MIVGFPCETDEDVEIQLDFLEQAQLDRGGCFNYEPVAGARANDLDGAVPDELKEERWHLIIQTQADISRARQRAKVGSVQEVLVDEIDEAGAIARRKADAPEIDRILRNTDARQLQPGSRVNVVVEDSDDYDLTARLAD